MITDELTSPLFTTKPLQEQERILREYCSHLENKISSASSKADAERIAEESCNQLRKHCSSEILLGQMDGYVQQLIKKYWNE